MIFGTSKWYKYLSGKSIQDCFDISVKSGHYKVRIRVDNRKGFYRVGPIYNLKLLREFK